MACIQCYTSWAQSLLTDVAWPLLLALVALVANFVRARTTRQKARTGSIAKVEQSRVESHSQPGMYSRAARLGAGLTLARMRSLAAGGGCRSCAAAASEGQAFVTVFAVKYGEVVLFELGDQVSHTTAAHGCEQGGSEEEYEMYACYRRARRLNLCSVDILASKRGLIGSLASGVLESSGGTPTDRVFAALTLRRGS
ncbi:hypothetical protein OF846_000709 [Rhodotorula toruloides]|nr:hypothetical protein OF846_000709 [Rhodotorula toruloides]